MWLNLLIGVVSLAGFLIGRRSGKPAGRITAYILLAVTLFCTVWGFTRSSDRDFAAKERGYYAAQAARVGMELKQCDAAGTVTLLVFENLKDTGEVEAFRRVLARFGDCGEISVRTVSLAHPEALTGADRLDAAEFSTVLKEAAVEGPVVSLVGLPRNLRLIREFRRGNPERAPLIAVCDDPVPQRILKENLIDGAVLPKPDAVFSTEPVSDYLKAFDERYRYIKAD